MRFNSALLGTSLGLLLTAGAAFADSGVAINFVNKTDWKIHNIFLSPTKQNSWGEDQLQDKLIETNSSFNLHGIPAGKYDVKIVDEDGDECVISAVKIAADETVDLTNEDLVGCQAATEAEADKDEE